MIDELGHSGPALLAGEGRRIGRDAGRGIASLGQKRPDGVWRADDEPCFQGALAATDDRPHTMDPAIFLDE